MTDICHFQLIWVKEKVSTMTTRKIQLFLMCLVFFQPALIFAQDLSAVTSNECLKSIVLSPSPPEIFSVSHNPENPAENQEWTVTAKILNDPERTDDTTDTAWVYYSADDGKTWQSVEMEQNEDNESLWQTKIPGQPKDTKIRYVVTSQDSGGNFASEIPKISSWPSPDSLSKAETVEEKSKLFPAFPLTSTDENCTEKNNEPDVDILGVSFSYDDEFVYGKITVEGTVHGGTMQKANGYGQAVLNLVPGQDPTVDLVTKLFEGGGLKGFVMLHIPLAPALGANVLGWVESPWAIDSRVATTYQPIPEEESAIVGYEMGRDFYWRAKRSLVGPDPDNLIVTAALAISILNPSSLIDTFRGGGGNTGMLIASLLGDISTITRAYLREHMIEVK